MEFKTKDKYALTEILHLEQQTSRNITTWVHQKFSSVSLEAMHPNLLVLSAHDRKK